MWVRSPQGKIEAAERKVNDGTEVELRESLGELVAQGASAAQFPSKRGGGSVQKNQGQERQKNLHLNPGT